MMKLVCGPVTKVFIFSENLRPPLVRPTSEHRRLPRLLCGTTSVIAFCLGGQSWASGAEAATAPPSPEAHVDHKNGPATDQLPPVVVTAEKKPELEQKTPVAMSVYGGVRLEGLGVSDLKSLSTIAPDVNFAQVQTVVPVITIRGISSRDVTEVGDPAVVVVTDGSSVNRPYALSGTLYDLEGIEVLRGPQNTLYGRNANGGLINIVTAKPAKDVEGSASVDLGNYNARNLAAMLNVPVNDAVQFRIAAVSRRHDGYLNNAPQSDGDDENTRSGRLSVAVEPSRDFHVLFTVQQTTTRGVGPVSLDIPYVYNADGSVSHEKPQFPDDPRTFTYATPQSLNISDTLARWSFTYDLPAVELSYTGGYDSLAYHHDGDSSASPGTPVSYQQNEYPKTQNHELRVASRGDTRWSWQAGASYFEESSTLYSANVAPFAGGMYLPTLAFAYDLHTASTAAFGQTSFELTDKVKLTAGLRMTRDEKSRVGEYFFADSNAQPLTYTHVPQDNSGSWSKPTVHLAAQWSPSAVAMTYMRFDTGYKAGGFSSAGPYAPETVKGVELGAKTRWLSGRLQINASAFDYDYTGQQISQLVPFANGQVGTKIVNAGRTQIYGADTDVLALIEPIGKINLSVAWLHARFTDFLVEGDGGQNVQLAGNAPPQSPTWSVGLGIEHAWPVPSGRLIGRVDAKFQSSQHFTVFNYGDDYEKPRLTADLSATYIPNGEDFEVLAYVRNVTNTLTYMAAEEYSFDDSYRYAFAAPRTFGVKVTYYW
ncbi:iron complex outermembrane receptor protein [Paraburkholderia sp. BL6669N2]|nr:iron complex outermembrane receptor protein [Paraburkholderia sp. BL6669N2]